ncbi:MAG TPA: sigma-70 family RNA polymerase sigma factor [Acidimicrobiia bacterium]
MDGIRRGSNDAYRAVYDHTASDLLSFAHGLLRNRASAEDVVQQAFLELVAAAPRFRGRGEALRVWLFKAVRFRCLDLLRRASSREIVTDVLPERQALDQSLLDVDPRLLAALDELSERQRSMILMRHVLGMSGAEVAAVVGLNRAAVYAVVSRAERKLRESVSEEGST